MQVRPRRKSGVMLRAHNSEGGGRDTVSEAWGAGADAKASEKKMFCSRYASSPYKSPFTVIRGTPAADCLNMSGAARQPVTFSCLAKKK